MRTGLKAMATVLALALALAGCKKKPDQADLDRVDRELVGGSANEADPAITSALADQIMVDPALTQQANDRGARAPVGPAQAPIPAIEPATPPPAPGLQHAPAPVAAAADGRSAVTLGELATEQARGPTPRRTAAACRNRDLRYSIAWADKMPADVPLYPQAQVNEAAGNDAPGCRMRIVSFVTGSPVQQVIDWYYTRVTRAGFSAEHQLRDDEHILAGTRAADDSAYYLTAVRRRGVTEVDLLSNNGR